MGETAENVANKYNLSREEQDQFAFESRMKCKPAVDAGRFTDENVPVESVVRPRTHPARYLIGDP
jgi:acetyl-CoA acetyltransferase